VTCFHSPPDADGMSVPGPERMYLRSSIMSAHRPAVVNVGGTALDHRRPDGTQKGASGIKGRGKANVRNIHSAE
jgi:hypothetical protein